MMKRLLYFVVLIFILVSCSQEPRLSISVRNPTALERTNETVEIAWEKLAGVFPGIDQNHVVVYDAKGKEIPSQVIFKGGEEPVALIFQVAVQPNAESAYEIKPGEPVEYKKQAYGRYIPERMDDYAWENNLVGHRMYGPALEATGEISNGIDTWVKRTGELLIDEWYKTGDYHKDHGKGMDCYKVGRTLGSGAMAPYVDGKIVLANNYIRQQTLDDGPIRTSFQLDYAPFKAGDAELTETRIISLDANSRFNRIEEIYMDAPENMLVAAGIVVRPEPGDTLMNAAGGMIGYWEPQNNDNGDDNGHLAIGLILSAQAKNIVVEDDHILALDEYRSGKSYVYYMGSGWSKGGVPSAQDWFGMLQTEQNKIRHPLVVKVSGK